MKRYTLYFVSLLMLGVTVSCKKENGEKYILNARMSNFQTSKAYIDVNNYSCFRSGESIRVNDQTCTVAPNAQDENHTCGIANVTESQNGYYAFYPSELLSGTPNISSGFNGVTVTLPQVQPYAEESGHQVINNPMAGHLSGSSGTIPLHNLCALLKITVKATTSATISSIDVTLRGTTIWGTGSVNVNDWSLEMVPQQDHSTVTLSFGQNGRQGKPTGETFYIVVPKSTVDIHTSSIQVTINGDNLDDALSHIKTYKIALTSSDNRVVAQNTIQLLPDVSIGYHLSYNEKCVFTVEAAANGRPARKVTIARANLIKAGNNFVFPGEPWHGPGSYTYYFYYNEYDFGWNNLITNNKDQRVYASHVWRTPTRDEWEYILTHTRGNNMSFAYVKANQRYGIMIFPDNYVGPTGLTAYPSNTIINPTNWEKYEKQGCVFLPAHGWSNDPQYSGNDGNDGYYASDNSIYNDMLRCLKFSITPGQNYSPNGGSYNYNYILNGCGVCVRLVHDLN